MANYFNVADFTLLRWMRTNISWLAVVAVSVEAKVVRRMRLQMVPIVHPPVEPLVFFALNFGSQYNCVYCTTALCLIIDRPTAISRLQDAFSTFSTAGPH